MASFTVTIPDAAVAEIVDALCDYGGYQTGNRANFAKAQLGNWLAAVYADHKAKQAADAARETARTTAATFTRQITVT